MGNLNINIDKLTPSAKEAFEEATFEFQELLITRANSLAQKGQTGDKEISLRDVLEAKEILFKTKVEKEKADQRRKRLMTLISLSGALYSLIGVLIYLWQNKEFSVEKNLGLIIAFTGVITIFVSYVYSQLITRRVEAKENKSDLDYVTTDSDFEIIKRWQIIEKMGSNLMRQTGYTDNESRSINDILKFLAKELKSDRLYLEMRELLNIRNKILHEGYSLTKQEKQLYIDNANRIIEQLEYIEK